MIELGRTRMRVSNQLESVFLSQVTVHNQFNFNHLRRIGQQRREPDVGRRLE